MNKREAKIQALHLATEYLQADIDTGALYEAFDNDKDADKVEKELETIIDNLRNRAAKLEINKSGE